jgi:hypothetical protein
MPEKGAKEMNQFTSPPKFSGTKSNSSRSLKNSFPKGGCLSIFFAPRQLPLLSLVY